MTAVPEAAPISLRPVPILSSPTEQFDLYQSLPDRVRSKVAYDPDGCWLWVGAVRDTGYGQIGIRLARRQYANKLAHRYVYELLVGPIPDGLQIDHLCRVITCVRPDHLEPVTQRENIARGESACAWNARKTHCKRGHPFAGPNLILVNDGRWRVCRTCRDRYSEVSKERAKAKRRAARERGTAA